MPEGAVEDRKELFTELTADILYIRRNIKAMLDLLKKAEATEIEDKCRIYFSQLKPLMEHIRRHVDDLESKMPDEMWVLPKYKKCCSSANWFLYRIKSKGILRTLAKSPFLILEVRNHTIRENPFVQNTIRNPWSMNNPVIIAVSTTDPPQGGARHEQRK